MAEPSSPLPISSVEKLRVEASYGSFEDLEKALDKYKETSLTVFVRKSSRTTQAANARLKTDEDRYDPRLKYAYVRWCCKHGGNHKTSSTGQRPHQTTYKLGCPAAIFATADRNSSRLVIKTLNDTHNHAVSSDIYMHYPVNREVDDKLKAVCRVMYNLKVPAGVFRDKLIEISGKEFTAKDILNLKSKIRMDNSDSGSKLNLLVTELEAILEQFPDAFIRLKISEVGLVEAIFIQMPVMRDSFIKFPEVCFLDATYRVNEHKMPLFTLMVEDGLGHSIPAAHFLVPAEDQENIDHCFDLFKQSLPEGMLDKTTCVVIDKDLKEVNTIKKFFPGATIHLCLFHVLRCFQRATKDIPVATKEGVRKVLENMAFCSEETQYDKLYDQLKELAPETFLTKFAKNWDECKEMWCFCWRKRTMNLGNKTTNRLESFHQKLKMNLNSSKTLAECIHELVQLSETKKGQIKHKTNIGSCSISYDATELSAEGHAIYETCSPFAAEKIVVELKGMRRMHTTFKSTPLKGNGYAVQSASGGSVFSVCSDMKTCSCHFFKNHGLPCRHIFFVRKVESTELFIPDLVSRRWRKEYQTASVATVPLPVPATMHDNVVLTVQATASKTKKTLNRCQKYREALGVCKEIASVICEHGQDVFNGYISNLKDFKACVLGGKEVDILDVNAGPSCDPQLTNSLMSVAEVHTGMSCVPEISEEDTLCPEDLTCHHDLNNNDVDPSKSSVQPDKSLRDTSMPDDLSYYGECYSDSQLDIDTNVRSRAPSEKQGNACFFTVFRISIKYPGYQ
ncbi:uncharacterized protein LOC135484821 [Lineus longissimus]|uniref:uncharacterized protein LOC135484821 n=1 Tax=Lineus longissimus TaxID=88925 RepID=UPI00315DA18F